MANVFAYKPLEQRPEKFRQCIKLSALGVHSVSGCWSMGRGERFFVFVSSHFILFPDLLAPINLHRTNTIHIRDSYRSYDARKRKRKYRPTDIRDGVDRFENECTKDICLYYYPNENASRNPCKKPASKKITFLKLSHNFNGQLIKLRLN